MADDAAAPDGELSKSTATEETSSATEPESAGSETAEAADTEKATDGEEDSAGDISEESAEDSADYDEEAAPPKPAMSHLRLATIVGLVLVVALAGLTGWLGFRTYQSHKADEERKLFLQVGRQGALNLTTIDWQQADANVKRILDSATGTFYDDFQKRAQPFVEVVKQAQSKSVGTIAEAGLESETDNGAQVLVAVTVRTSNAGAPEQAPRAWRMRISVQKVGDEAKVSNVEFVP
ncbi:MAG: Mce-associated rane protein [Mycobacterium sp.]|jgi:Mce-associated membrane protein|nr:Mce-associated rane protein [Mycobacterium sp.]